jgi:hypothetical protein
LAQKCHQACRNPLTDSIAGMNNSSRQRGSTPRDTSVIQIPSVAIKPNQPRTLRSLISDLPILQTPGIYSLDMNATCPYLRDTTNPKIRKNK